MKIHIFIISADLTTFSRKGLGYLEKHPQIVHCCCKAFKDKTLLKVKSENNLINHQIKRIIYSQGIYGKVITNPWKKNVYRLKMLFMK